MKTEMQCSSVHVCADVGASGAGRSAKRGDVLVIVDALRASATIVAALQAGARQVIPVLSVQEAELYLDDPTYRVAGERGGARLPRFHYGNSPTQVWADGHEIAGRTLVLTTSNGTRCVKAGVAGSTGLLIGSTINATAVASAALGLALRHERSISLVAAGLHDQPAEEDVYSVGLIASRLADLGALLAPQIRLPEEADSPRVFWASPSAAGLARLGYEEDVRLCAQVDLWVMVPVYRDGGFVPYSRG